LGHLKSALEYQIRTRDEAIRSGNVLAQAISLGNIGAIKTKCGQTREAELIFSQARIGVKGIDASDVVDSFSAAITVEADTAMYAIHKGDYCRAYHHIKNVRRFPDSSPNIDYLFCEIIRCKFFIEIGLTGKVRDLLQRITNDSEIFKTDYMCVERALVAARLPDTPITLRRQDLEHALALAEALGTLYQQCELLISLATVYFELRERQQAEDYVCRAVDLARKNGYGILLAKALLLSAVVGEKVRERERFLYDTLQLATEMGLQELIAESTYRLGLLNLESGNIVTAREYLIRSTSITARLAAEVPAAARSKYLSKEWRRDALRMLERCNESVPMQTLALFQSDGDKYFTAAYQFTMSASIVNTIEGLIGLIDKTLTASFTRAAVITLKIDATYLSTPVRIKISPDLTRNMDEIRSHAKNRVYFQSRGEKGKQVDAWIPIHSETCEGGIYVPCRAHDASFTEKEIELLTMMGTISSSALRRLETRKAGEAEPEDVTEFHGIIGASKSIKEVFSQIRMAARNTATVLIEGESGTGKELVAKAIHAEGPRAKEPFIPVDCGAIPESLIEAELFGSKRGSYTGAIADRPGLFESAHRGTIFLDEISNTTQTLQAKLLRVIQERKVRRIGETKDRPIDVRLVVASNQSLQALTETGGFRKDLLYRLNVLHIKIPPLRERSDDIPMLAHTFLRRLNASNKTKKYFAAGLIDHLSTHKFPGNIRELQNAIEAAFFTAQGTLITDIRLEGSISGNPAAVDEVQSWFKDISEGRKDFWSAIHRRYKRRDIPREKVVALIDFGLRATRGSYTDMAAKLRLTQKGYRKFMDFLRRNDCLLDFRPYRKAAAANEN